MGIVSDGLCIFDLGIQAGNRIRTIKIRNESDRVTGYEIFRILIVLWPTPCRYNWLLIIEHKEYFSLNTSPHQHHYPKWRQCFQSNKSEIRMYHTLRGGRTWYEPTYYNHKPKTAAWNMARKNASVQGFLIVHNYYIISPNIKRLAIIPTRKS